MGKVNTLLTERLKKTASPKMEAMARQSANGNLTSFSGVFSIAELSEMEKSGIEAILREYAINTHDVSKDLNSLINITSEVKAINNQAALLHGERIKKAHSILTRYRDGAFTAWLISAYGNRQTPYNLMQYYDFCEAMPKTLRFQIELMPRQAIYTLASREGPIEQKQRIVEDYKGQTKAELLGLIRKLFPLEESDRRRKNNGESIVLSLKKIYRDLKRGPNSFTHTQKEAALTLLSEIKKLIETSKGSSRS